ncbi:MAG: inositol monophosphatase [Acidimicrobiia bacterium]
MQPEDLLELFAETTRVVRAAVAGVDTSQRRARTDVPGQYAIDLVADAAALEVLHSVPVAVVSEESGRTGDADAPVTVVVDPIDGSTNCSRGLPYWAISLCAVDADGALAATVVNQATMVATTAVRGRGAWRDGAPISASQVERIEDSVVLLEAWPVRKLRWKQFRALGSAALGLCDVAAGVVDGYVDANGLHKPWDYLGGLLACREAGAAITDLGGRPLDVVDPAERRQILAAGTGPLLACLREAVEG